MNPSKKLFVFTNIHISMKYYVCDPKLAGYKKGMVINMGRQLKAELYKIRHSSVLTIGFIIMMVIFGASFLLGEINFFSSGNGIITYIGFQAKSYVAKNGPLFEEVVRSSLAYTAFFWCIALIIAVIFFQSEYNWGTIKLSISYGITKWRIYLAKTAAVFFTVFCMYLLFTGAFFAVETVQSGYRFKHEELFEAARLILLNSVVVVGFLCLIICLISLIQNTGIVVCIGCIYIFAGMSVYLMLWNHMQSVSRGLRLFIYCNPMYYWMNFSSCKTQGIIENMWIFLLFHMFLLLLGGVISNKKEIR